MKGNEGPERLIRSHLQNVQPYAYVAPLEAATAESGVPADRIIKLDGNENPYGCSPLVKKALMEYPFYHIYPDSEQRELRQALQSYVGAPFESIIAGSGSDELIEFIMRLFIDPGDGVINCVPTFGMYQFSTAAWGGKVTAVPRDSSFAIDVAAVKKAAGKGAKIIFIASPNNPSGNVTPAEDILQLLELPAVVVLDEAYYEFSQKTLVPLVEQHENLIILRTFSKWAGLAGLRVGYGVFPSKIAKHLMSIKPPYNVNAAAQVAALQSLRDLEYLQGTIKAIVAERQRLFDKLARFPKLRPWPSEANFILCSVIDHDARSIYQELRRRGILIRYFDTPLLKECIRISVGKPEHTDALVAALSDILLE
ncbi:MAG: histidinol-phosphate transaminase [Dehalococcoidia bacterium]|nr:histidinol-phosphate transaminase [Dehalococcoidia bacterium]